jgi:hypothetical protein
MDRRGRRGSQEARSRGKERKPHLSGARRRIPKRRHWQGEPDRGETQRRRARLCAWQNAGAGGSTSMDGCCLHSAQRQQPRFRRRPRCRSSGQAEGGEGRLDARRSRDWRDATGEVRGNSRIRLSLAARRSKKRGIRLLRAYAGQRPVVLRRPLPNGLSVAAGAAECAGAARDSREFVAAIVRSAKQIAFRWTPRSMARRQTGVLADALWSAADAAGDRVYRPAVPSNTQMRPGALTPASRRVEADWISSGRKAASRAVVSM